LYSILARRKCWTTQRKKEYTLTPNHLLISRRRTPSLWKLSVPKWPLRCWPKQQMPTSITRMSKLGCRKRHNWLNHKRSKTKAKSLIVSTYSMIFPSKPQIFKPWPQPIRALSSSCKSILKYPGPLHRKNHKQRSQTNRAMSRSTNNMSNSKSCKKPKHILPKISREKRQYSKKYRA